jgi:hypothetical protein
LAATDDRPGQKSVQIGRPQQPLSIYDVMSAADKHSPPPKPGSDPEAHKAYFAELEDLTAQSWLRSA